MAGKMRLILRSVVCAVVLAIAIPDDALADEDVIVVRLAVGGSDLLNRLPREILTLALEKSGQPFRFEITDVPYNTPYQRNRKLENGYNVIWGGDYPSREPYWKPVRIPMMYGFTGYRQLVIRRDRQEEFAKIRTLAELGEMRAVLPKNWVMTKVLETAGMNVVYGDTKNILQMVQSGRADYFPGLAIYDSSTITEEFEDLIVEENLLMESTHIDVYFADNRDERLHSAIETGLALAYEDGSLREFLQGHPETKGVATKMRLSQRLVLEMDNPLMRPEAAQVLEEFLKAHDAENVLLSLK